MLKQTSETEKILNSHHFMMSSRKGVGRNQILCVRTNTFTESIFLTNTFKHFVSNTFKRCEWKIRRLFCHPHHPIIDMYLHNHPILRRYVEYIHTFVCESNTGRRRRRRKKKKEQTKKKSESEFFLLLLLLHYWKGKNCVLLSQRWIFIQFFSDNRNFFL